ncbi:hypothetical protein M434DRAFT_69565 [Hypoxylon sp. CO27-5]|nr:hypothetical protein M434DRAFT_69565 [Hypoxylon sp. CO27-5]
MKLFSPIIFSIINGFAGLDGFPIALIVRLLGRFHNMIPTLNEVLGTNRSHVIGSLAENLFRAAIEAGDEQIVSRLLTMNLLKLNEIVCVYEGMRYTPIELASMLQSSEVMKALVHHNVDVNKTFMRGSRRGGALNTFLMTIANKSGAYSEWGWAVDLVNVLLKAGANVHGSIFGDLYDSLHPILISLLLMSVPPASHQDIIMEQHLSNIARHFEDTQATEHALRLLRACELLHEMKCFTLYPSEVDLAIAIAASRGNGALKHLSTEWFISSIAAASKVDDLNYIKKLLLLRLSPRPENLALGFLYAVRNNNESIASELLDAGADVNCVNCGPVNSDRDYSDRGKPLNAAIIQRNSRLVRAILSADIKGGNYAIDSIGLAEAIRWGDKSIIMDLITSFPATSFPDDVDESMERLTKALDSVSNDLFSFLLDSVFTNRKGLTFCLTIAIRKHDIHMIKQLVERGADISAVLELAIEEYPDSLKILMEEMANGIRPIVNQAGMPALIASIKRGLGNTAALDSLLRSGFFDLRKRTVCYYGGRYLSPLGLAIIETENHRDPNFSIIKQLLDAGCNINSIAEYTTEGFVVSQTALLLAIEIRNEDLVRLFVDRGADVNARALLTIKRTPLQRAAEVGSTSIVRLLLENGADVNAEPAIRSGGTALQLAAISGNCMIIADLLDKGASLYALPSKINGRWPLEGAAEHGRLDMIQFLCKVHEQIITVEPCSTGFEPEQCQRAMRRAEEKGFLACRDLIADLTFCRVRLPT